jgi:hypothetical protein
MRRLIFGFLLLVGCAACSPAPETPVLPTLAVLPTLIPSATPSPSPVPPSATPLPSATPPFYAALGTLIGEIPSGAVLQGRLESPQARDVYRLRANAGDYLSADMERLTGEIDPLLRLFSPAGEEIAADDNAGGNRGALLRNVRLSEGGDYYLQTWGRGFAGEYRLALTLGAEAVPVSAALVVVPSVTPVVETLPPTVVPAINGQLLLDHTPVTSRIDAATGVLRFSLRAAQGQQITIGAVPALHSAVRLRLELVDPEGSVAATASAEADGSALIAAYPAATTGTYSLFITPENGSAGDFNLSYGVGSSRAETRRGLTVPDQLYSGEIARRGLRDGWTLDLTAGMVVSAAVKPLIPGLNPALELAAPDGSTVALATSQRGGEAQIASVRVPLDGRYHLRVSSVDAGGAGAYTLVWRLIEAPPTPTPPPSALLLMAFEDTAPDRAYVFFPFYGVAGTQVEIRVVAATGSGFDPVVGLLAPDGSLLAEADDEGSDLNPRLQARLPQDGTYRVRVNGYQTGGAFTLTVQALLGAP